MTPIFSQETKSQIAQAQNFYCRVDGCLKPIHSIHHKCKNTKSNRANFPLLINSVLNGVGLCFEHHSQESHLYKITLQEATIYEAYLQKLATNRPSGQEKIK